MGGVVVAVMLLVMGIGDWLYNITFDFAFAFAFACGDLRSLSYFRWRGTGERGDG